MTNAKYEIITYITNDMLYNEFLEKLYEKALYYNIIGYHIQRNKKYAKFGQAVEKVQLFCVDGKTGIDIISNIIDSLCKVRNNNTIEYKNPPLENWIPTHSSWVNKEVFKFAKQFNLDFDDVLSEMYQVLLKAKNKNIYLSNISYLKTMFVHHMRTLYRDNKPKFATIALDTTIDDDNNTLMDVIANDMMLPEMNMEYNLFLKTVKSLLRRTFTEREITMILDGNSSNAVDRSLHRKLIIWREKHDTNEIYELMEKTK